ncbi:MAG TPA: hypothetical protein VJV22_15690 [Acidobacteriaceae bacterium]|nr:hypothetical protein [Acidobacteriaceae bacterium]
MYATCLFCHTDLGANHRIPSFPVGHRLAFDPARGRLWVVCTRCGRWNLSPLEERWEAIDECERLFRGTRLRFSTGNVGLARLLDGFELVRIGPALLPEIASWRYGTRLTRRGRAEQLSTTPGGRIPGWVARTAASALASYATSVGLSDDAMLRLRTFRRGSAVLARGTTDDGRRLVIRYAHLRDAELIRPDQGAPWRIVVRHDSGMDLLAEGAALQTAGTLLATLNFGVASAGEVRHAIAKLDEAGDQEGYFARVASLALRTSWGRLPDAPPAGIPEPAGRTIAERIALQLANRSFWGRGGTGSEEATPLYRLPAVDRLALEMAANEDVERRALAGELTMLADAWREAEEIAEIADDLLSGRVLEEFKRQYYERVARGAWGEGQV